LAQALVAAQRAGVDRLDAQMLLLHSCGQSPHARAWLLTHDHLTLSETQRQQWLSAITQRLDQVPLAYLTGEKEFFGLSLDIDSRVLDPRPDTEILVEWALTCIPTLANNATPHQVIDLGTGSGAIALALQSQRADLRVWAVDASLDALQVAQHNAHKLQLPVQFVQNNWLNQWGRNDAANGQARPPTHFALIVSNPPYIAQDDPHMQALRHEPEAALTAGADGLDDVRTIIAQAPHHLVGGGWLLLEHGWNQAQDVQELLKRQGFSHVQSRVDLAGIPRVSGGQWLNVK
jgi:release factor glutamine methyltransferase